jgi:hypothetical protein
MVLWVVPACRKQQKAYGYCINTIIMLPNILEQIAAGQLLLFIGGMSKKLVDQDGQTVQPLVFITRNVAKIGIFATCEYQ